MSSMKSMRAMQRLQPEIERIRERYKNNADEAGKRSMQLYKDNKVNPAGGCLPMLLQMPLFFALYAVLNTAIDLRQAPFFGWIHDLSAVDPTNVFNLFGLIPFDPTVIPMIGPMLHLGAWPLIMGVTMFLQQKLNPPPPDPVQAKIFNFLPIIFTFMLARFPVGLVIYWAWNNILSVGQQWVIMKRHGVEVNLLGNIVDSLRRKPKTNEAAKS